MMAVAHETWTTWLAENWYWVVLWLWILGVFGWAGDAWKNMVAERRRHEIDLEYARRGLPPPGRFAPADDDWDEDDDDWDDEDEEVALPAAAIPAPPSARRLGPGPCQHEKIVPVIDGDGNLLRWICANYQRCDAEFDKSVAIYEPDAID